jgi:hypothetical protein
MAALAVVEAAAHTFQITISAQDQLVQRVLVVLLYFTEVHRKEKK